ncbi:MAG: hypothetical protein ACKVQC_07125 [Elusimicrobiota bacterium]
MKRSIAIIIAIVTNALCLSCGVNNVNHKYQYGQSVDYTSNRESIFPDFSLRFIAKSKHRDEGSVFQRDRYEFLVTDGKTKKTVFWIHGGLLGPATFELSGKKFCLLPGVSDDGTKREGTVTVMPESDFWEKANNVNGI